MSLLSIWPAPTLLEYFFTKERVTLEKAEFKNEVKIPYLKQLKAIFTDKYMIIIYLYFSFTPWDRQLRISVLYISAIMCSVHTMTASHRQ